MTNPESIIIFPLFSVCANYRLLFSRNYVGNYFDLHGNGKCAAGIMIQAFTKKHLVGFVFSKHVGR